MKKPSVVHLITSLKMGGAESLLVDFLAHCSRQRYDITVLYFYPGPHVERLQVLGIPTMQIAGNYLLYDPVFFIRLFKAVRQLKPDYIHTWLWSANIAGRIVGKLLGIPVLNSLHNNIDQDGWVRRLFDRSTQWMATDLIAVSDGVARSFLEFYRSPKQGLSVIKNGINAVDVQEKGLANPIKRAELGIAEDAFVIGSVGRFVPLKNYSLLIKAFALIHQQYSHTHLVLVGSGPQEELLRSLVDAYNLRKAVTFIIGQSAYGYYPLFDCFVLSSFKEGISMALLEAMSFSLPCISTHGTLVHDVIIPDYNGILVPSGNTEALAGAFKTLINTPENRYALGKNAFKTVHSQFCLATMVESYEAIYYKKMNYLSKALDK